MGLKKTSIFFYFLLFYISLLARDSGKFNLIFEQQMSATEKKMLNVEIQRFSGVLDSLFHFSKRSVTIIKFMPQLHSKIFPEWGIGFFSPSENTIYLNMSKYHDRATFYQVLRHELVHAWSYDFRYRKNVWPLWFEEGLAEFGSGKTIEFADAKKISMAIAGNKLLSQDSLLSITLNRPYHIELFYLQSYFIVNLLNSNGLLDSYIQGDFWGPDKKRPPGFVDWIDFEIWWQTALEKSFKWFLILNFDFSFAILFVILFFIVYIVKSFRYRQRFKELQASEMDEDRQEG